MVTKEFEEKCLECVEGDITTQQGIDAVVNAANAELRPGGGVAGAIHRAAGPRLDEACREPAPIRPGEAVITPAFNLPNRYVIHVLGPVYGVDTPSDGLLAQCYTEALYRAEDREIESVAFPAISTGAFGYPIKEAAPVAWRAVMDSLPELSHVRLVRFCLFGDQAYTVFSEALSNS